MKKSLLFILALLLAMMLSTGTVLANSDNGNAWGNSNKDKKLTETVELQICKQANEKVQSHSETQKVEKKHVQERVKKSVQEAFKAYCNEKSSQDTSQFSDVNQHWATRSIKDMAAVGLFKGYPDGTFKPNQQLTQDEALALVMRIYEEDAATPSTDDEATLNEEDNLVDVPAWVREDAGKAARKGIIKLNRFHSGVQASRAQTAVMIAKALGLEPVETGNMPFKDGLLISKEDVGYILALYQEGIMTGSPNGNFNPNNAITRAEMASMLERLLNKSEVESVSLPETATVEQGKSITLEATVKYADGTTDNQVTWLSSDTSLATVVNGVVTAAADKTGTVTITATASRGESSESATCTVTIVEEQQVITGLLSFTGNIGSHDGKVYQEYALKANDTTISLAQDKVKSITLQKEGADLIQLSANTDSTLWFNVQRESGKYTLSVIDTNDKSYVATLDWTAPTAVTATATGNNREQDDGIKYVEYKLGDLDLSSFDCMHQIKPDGQVVGFTVGSDTNLWFQTSSQISGEHTFLIKKNGVWYSSKINI
ncbi:MAG: S-layer homology domain-containing protein [Syntrophomonas sp.]|nr:S-layer homology domain-containing protein [Syntrophomonas sp.]